MKGRREKLKLLLMRHEDKVLEDLVKEVVQTWRGGQSCLNASERLTPPRYLSHPKELKQDTCATRQWSGLQAHVCWDRTPTRCFFFSKFLKRCSKISQGDFMCGGQ